jgi:hypothetical protein
MPLCVGGLPRMVNGEPTVLAAGRPGQAREF